MAAPDPQPKEGADCVHVHATLYMLYKIGEWSQASLTCISAQRAKVDSLALVWDRDEHLYGKLTQQLTQYASPILFASIFRVQPG